MTNPVILGIISWFFPGAGHLMQGKITRGIIIFVVIWGMFIIAILSGGAHYPGFGFKDGALLYLLNIFAKFGNGLGAIVSMIMAGSPSPQVAALATFEYGGRFLEVAGLLNYLAILHTLDIALWRKKCPIFFTSLAVPYSFRSCSLFCITAQSGSVCYSGLRTLHNSSL